MSEKIKAPIIGVICPKCGLTLFIKTNLSANPEDWTMKCDGYECENGEKEYKLPVIELEEKE